LNFNKPDPPSRLGEKWQTTETETKKTHKNKSNNTILEPGKVSNKSKPRVLKPSAFQQQKGRKEKRDNYVYGFLCPKGYQQDKGIVFKFTAVTF